MSHIALARKWRPQRFEDVIGQRGVVETLKNAIASGRLAQSFIFAGPRGVGKTTTARILARALNCVQGPTGEPCGTCDACIEIAEGRDMDVLEIDGATYTGVDDVREVIVEPLAIAPMRDRFKIFIIDEVHRLSAQAFDALLKSIEEPPPHVRFMMATTELQKVPATIQSRSQVFELRALPFSAIRHQLERVTTQEGIAIDDAAITLVARSAEGSMRDALSALDQVLAFTSDRVTAESVSTVLGLIGRDLQLEIVETIAREDVAGAFALADRVVEAGVDLRIVYRELARLVRDLLVITIDGARLNDPEIAAEGEREPLRALAGRFSREDLLRAFDLLSKAEGEIRSSSQPRHHFEMTLVKWIHFRQLTPLGDILQQMGGPAAASATPRRAAPPGPAPAPAPQAPRPPAPAPAPVTPKSSAPPSAGPREPRTAGTDRTPGTPDLKSAVLGTIREQNKTFHGMVIAQAQSIEVEGQSLVFTFAPVHRSLRAELERKRGWVEQLAQSVTGKRVPIVVREGQPAPPPAGAAEAGAESRKAALRERAKSEPEVQAVLDVFGGEIEDVEELDR